MPLAESSPRQRRDRTVAQWMSCRCSGPWGEQPAGKNCSRLESHPNSCGLRMRKGESCGRGRVATRYPTPRAQCSMPEFLGARSPAYRHLMRWGFHSSLARGRRTYCCHGIGASPYETRGCLAVSGCTDRHATARLSASQPSLGISPRQLLPRSTSRRAASSPWNTSFWSTPPSIAGSSRRLRSPRSVFHHGAGASSWRRTSTADQSPCLSRSHASPWTARG